MHMSMQKTESACKFTSMTVAASRCCSAERPTLTVASSAKEQGCPRTHAAHHAMRACCCDDPMQLTLTCVQLTQPHSCRWRTVM